MGRSVKQVDSEEAAGWHESVRHPLIHASLRRNDDPRQAFTIFDAIVEPLPVQDAKIVSSDMGFLMLKFPCSVVRHTGPVGLKTKVS